MVFEDILVSLLNRYLGDYVENLDQSKLKIGLMGGGLVLQNLIMKQNALDDLNLPIKTLYGHLGKLVMKIPWESLYSARVIITLERLFVLAVPNQDIKYNPKKEEKAFLEAKQKELERIEQAKKHERERGMPHPPDTFLEKIITNVIKNVQITIQDIHIRYEDRITVPKQQFSLGITLHNLSVQTTDDQWKECMIQDDTILIYKVICS